MSTGLWVAVIVAAFFLVCLVALVIVFTRPGPVHPSDPNHCAHCRADYLREREPD